MPVTPAIHVMERTHPTPTTTSFRPFGNQSDARLLLPHLPSVHACDTTTTTTTTIHIIHQLTSCTDSTEGQKERHVPTDPLATTITTIIIILDDTLPVSDLSLSRAL
jgi:hypothetical protein